MREALEAHLQAGEGRFKGIRHLTSWDAEPSLMNPVSAGPRGLLLDKHYRDGVAQLATLGLSYDAWLFFPQLPELIDLAKAFPDTMIIVNHCGGVVRIASYEDHRPEVFETWRKSMRELARLPNVNVKVGGLGMRINGFDFEKGEAPPSSAPFGANLEALDGDMHRGLWRESLHVRKQFPRRQGLVQLCHRMERVQATDLLPPVLLIATRCLRGRPAACIG